MKNGIAALADYGSVKKDGSVQKKWMGRMSVSVYAFGLTQMKQKPPTPNSDGTRQSTSPRIGGFRAQVIKL
jgi:hypothetical protein